MPAALDAADLKQRRRERATPAPPPPPYPDRELLEAALPCFDAATQAVAHGVIVDGLQEEQVAAALGVSRRTVARKLGRFLVLARQHVAAAAALMALSGSPAAAHDAAPMSTRDPPQAPRAEERAREAAPAPLAPGEAAAPAGPGAPAAREERRDVAQEIHAIVASRMRRHDPATQGRVARAVLREAELASLDPLLVLALIHVESSFDPRAVSSAGAMGLMQLREATMRRETERSGLRRTDPRDPVVNVQAGVRYLRRLVDAFGGVDVALMAYNAGPNRILGHLRRGKVPERFHAYPRKVKGEIERLRVALRGGARPPAPLAAADALHRRPAG